MSNQGNFISKGVCSPKYDGFECHMTPNIKQNLQDFTIFPSLGWWSFARIFYYIKLKMFGCIAWACKKRICLAKLPWNLRSPKIKPSQMCLCCKRPTKSFSPLTKRKFINCMGTIANPLSLNQMLQNCVKKYLQDVFFNPVWNFPLVQMYLKRYIRFIH